MNAENEDQRRDAQDHVVFDLTHGIKLDFCTAYDTDEKWVEQLVQEQGTGRFQYEDGNFVKARLVIDFDIIHGPSGMVLHSVRQ